MKFATNPLPGMNPWLEAFWGDLHTSLTTYARIPLRATAKDVVLPLQPLVNKAYENGRYANDLDYSAMPVPPLNAEQHAWIADYLKSKTQKTGSA